MFYLCGKILHQYVVFAAPVIIFSQISSSDFMGDFSTELIHGKEDDRKTHGLIVLGG